MRLASLLAGAVVAIGLAAASSASQATVLVPAQNAVTHQSLAQPVGYWWRHRYWRPGFGGYCWRWRHVCADRWGWGSYRFGRCMAIHGC